MRFSHTHKNTQTDRQTGRHTHRDTQAQTHTHSQTDTHTHTQKHLARHSAGCTVAFPLGRTLCEHQNAGLKAGETRGTAVF